MTFKDIRVQDAASIADAAVDYSCNLPKALISALHIRIHGIGGASSVALANTMVTKIRIDTDGKDKKPLELSATQLVRREGILFGIPVAVIDADGAYSELPVNVFFGTKARDKRLMLDLRKCNKRKLALTFDTDLVDAARFAAGAPKITIIATVWVGATPTGYRGHIRQEQVLAFATGTGDLKTDELPLHSGGMIAFMEIITSAITTVENVEFTANSDSVLIINEHIRDIIHRMNYERHLDTALTLSAYIDFMFVNRYETQLASLSVCSMMENTKIVIERGSTTTTVVIMLGTILA